MNYHWLTNLFTPIDDTDGIFLNTLKDYRLGPPQATKEKSRDQLVLSGVIGVYTTEEAIIRKEVRNLTGFDLKSLSLVKLGDGENSIETDLRAWANYHKSPPHAGSDTREYWPEDLLSYLDGQKPQRIMEAVNFYKINSK